MPPPLHCNHRLKPKSKTQNNDCNSPELYFDNYFCGKLFQYYHMWRFKHTIKMNQLISDKQRKKCFIQAKIPLTFSMGFALINNSNLHISQCTPTKC